MFRFLTKLIHKVLKPKSQLDWELREEGKRLAERSKHYRRLRTRNGLARINAAIDALEEAGAPYNTHPSKNPPVPPVLRVPEFVYETSDKTGYPFVPKIESHKMRFEQDPLFGWIPPDWQFGPSLLDGFSTVPVNAFPRELFPDRPSSLRTQIAQDWWRFQSRLWYETLPQYSGPVGHLRNYVIGSGMSINVTLVEEDEESGGEKRTEQIDAQPVDSDPEKDADRELAQRMRVWLKKFAKRNKLRRKVRQSVLNLFRDGENALRVVRGEEFPGLRIVDTSTIRGPHNEIVGPWSFGVLTRWPREWDEPIAYHLWYSDNSHEDVSPDEMCLARLDTVGSNVKRGVPLAYLIRKQLPQLSRLLDCMALGEAARQSIPYVVQHVQADAAQINESMFSVLTGATTEGEYPEESEIKPGEVQHINKGSEYMPPPSAAATNQGGTNTYRALCEAIAAALNVPAWMVTSTADKENYAASTVTESPLTKLIEQYQCIVTDHFEEIFGYAIDMSGEFPEDWRDHVEIRCKLPPPIARDQDKQVATDISLMHEGLKSPQHVCAAQGLNFAEERELTDQAEKQGWEMQAGAMDEPGEGRNSPDNPKMDHPTREDPE